MACNDWEEFKSWYSAHFGDIYWKNSEAAWKEFVCQERTRMSIIRAACAPLCKRHAQAIIEGKSLPKPTLTVITNLYFALVKKNQRSWEAAQGKCPICGGCGWVYVVMGDDGAVNIRSKFKFPGIPTPSTAACSCAAGRRNDEKAPDWWRERNVQNGFAMNFQNEKAKILSGRNAVEQLIVRNWQRD